MSEKFDPEAEFALHEALHTASIVLDIIERQLLNHQSFAKGSPFRKRAKKLFRQSFKLYQEIGAYNAQPIPRSTDD